jgi:hypothetical protein
MQIFHLPWKRYRLLRQIREVFSGFLDNFWQNSAKATKMLDLSWVLWAVMRLGCWNNNHLNWNFVTTHAIISAGLLIQKEVVEYGVGG